MAYTLDLDDDGILQVTISGDFTEKELTDYMHDLSEVLADVAKNDKLTSYIDTTNLARVNPNLTRAVDNFLDIQKFRETAVLGNSRIVKVMIDFVLKTNGKNHITYFTDRDEATNWLKESK